ncbi:hypothetical protein HZA56_19135 [Candidatus Poribacteria bacterium]|nr:hypothetical protein [Candidatus Poribacteria bacterium]
MSRIAEYELQVGGAIYVWIGGHSAEEATMRKESMSRGAGLSWRDALTGKHRVGQAPDSWGMLPRHVRNGVIGTVLVVGFVGCATASGTMPSPGQLAAGGVAASEADMAALGRGRALAVTECTTCHRLYWPHEYPAEAWPGIVRKMGPRASLTGDQMEDLSVYLVTASKAARKTEGAGGH